jgi:ABC-2 type transport system permease protein
VKAYASVISAHFRVLLQYRAAAAAGIGTRLFWGLIRVMIFEAFYRSTTAAQPISYPEIVTYVWLGQAQLALILWRVDSDVRQMIRTGSVAYELARPADLYGLWYSRALAAGAAPTLMQAGPVMLCGFLFFGMKLPPSALAALLWLASVLAALLLSAALATLMTVSLLWTIAGDGISRLLPALTYLLSGIMVPIPLFPDWLQPLMNFLPFRGVADTPFRVYIGHMGPAEAAGAILHQLAWAAALALLGRWLVQLGTRRMVIQGG